MNRKRALGSLFVFLWGLFNVINLYAQQFTACFNYEVGSLNQYKTVHNFYTSDFINDELNKKGSGVIWNLHDSEIVYGGSVSNLEIVQANQANGYNNFVGANIMKRFFDEFDQFLFQDSSGIYLIGELSNPLIKYHDKKKLINYPHGLFECSLDSFSIDSLQNFFGGWITESKGISQNCFDGEGEIHFNSGVIVTAYRYTRIDTLRYLNEGLPAMKVDMETYWYESNCNLHTPVMFAKGYQDANGFQHYSTIYILQEYALVLGNDLKEEVSSFSYKMIGDDILLKNTSYDTQTIHFVDLTGRIIDRATLKPYQNNISIPINQISAGIYFLQSYSGGSYKISITH